jgi:hypothetical protein
MWARTTCSSPGWAGRAGVTTIGAISRADSSQSPRPRLVSPRRASSRLVAAPRYAATTRARLLAIRGAHTREHFSRSGGVVDAAHVDVSIVQSVKYSCQASGVAIPNYVWQEHQVAKNLKFVKHKCFRLYKIRSCVCHRKQKSLRNMPPNVLFFIFSYMLTKGNKINNLNRIEIKKFSGWGEVVFWWSLWYWIREIGPRMQEQYLIMCFWI